MFCDVFFSYVSCFLLFLRLLGVMRPQRQTWPVIVYHLMSLSRSLSSVLCTKLFRNWKRSFVSQQLIRILNPLSEADGKRRCPSLTSWAPVWFIWQQMLQYSFSLWPAAHINTHSHGGILKWLPDGVRPTLASHLPYCLRLQPGISSKGHDLCESPRSPLCFHLINSASQSIMCLNTQARPLCVSLAWLNTNQWSWRSGPVILKE